MSIFTTIIKDLESVASKIEKEFQRLFQEAPSWITIVDGFITYAGPIVVTITTLLEGPALGNDVSAILTQIKTKLATAAAVVGTVNAATSIPALLTAIQGDIPQLLALVQVKDAALASKVETYTSLLVSELNALIAAAPAPASNA